ncbi:hypothetical protein P175DRAFT_0528100 [Aspergillus ochraceoroseus IBT 24754]|uniref:Uncharacterized protein n=1 Tax=Aspergillus ochraceoroseus IBT 24754 TaxID=1392256 RepID=A0A2T5M7V0_9EURO|nr:uncharacterized protein P175DRAFT_0528100 [Aspergillus ochraceoroseus IBT 24754]PTU24605.1 hypothetical protein P175DRAFT_0528100 [Aspergillus ochraceoroseus IBT 24754]
MTTSGIGFLMISMRQVMDERSDDGSEDDDGDDGGDDDGDGEGKEVEQRLMGRGESGLGAGPGGLRFSYLGLGVRSYWPVTRQPLSHSPISDEAAHVSITEYRPVFGFQSAGPKLSYQFGSCGVFLVQLRIRRSYIAYCLPA